MFAVAGCQQTGLPTFPVTGQVLYQDGTPLSEGAVRFSSTSDPLLIISGPIARDGSFTLTTLLADGTRVPGTIAGDHVIAVGLPQGPDQVTPQVHQDITQAKVGAEINHFIIKIETSTAEK